MAARSAGSRAKPEAEAGMGQLHREKAGVHTVHLAEILAGEEAGQ